MDRAFVRMAQNLENGQNFEVKFLKNILKWISLKYRRVIKVIFCIRLLLHHKTFKIKSRVVADQNTCYWFGDLFSFGLVWQYPTNQKQYDLLR
jgi:hypothetical protein